MIKGLIAEIGNNHFGSLKKAKEMIKAAHEYGADYVKLQAIDPEIVNGSMPREFYRHVALTYQEYLELKDYGDYIGTTVFFSCFGMFIVGRLHKISGSQYRTFEPVVLKVHNNEDTIISIPADVSDLETKSAAISKMSPMYVSQYLENDVDLSWIDKYSSILNKQVGYSDHTIGIETCTKAIRNNGARLIEKHFHLGSPIKWEGQLFRDSIHSCSPGELAKIKECLDAMPNL